MTHPQTRIARLERSYRTQLESFDTLDNLFQSTWNAGPESWAILVDVIAETLEMYGPALAPERIQFYRDLGPPQIDPVSVV